MSPARWGAAPTDAAFFFCGGTENRDVVCELLSVKCYDTDADSWESATMSHARCGPQAARINSCLYVLGGGTRSAERFDPVSGDGRFFPTRLLKTRRWFVRCSILLSREHATRRIDNMLRHECTTFFVSMCLKELWAFPQCSIVQKEARVLPRCQTDVRRRSQKNWAESRMILVLLVLLGKRTTCRIGVWCAWRTWTGALLTRDFWHGQAGSRSGKIQQTQVGAPGARSCANRDQGLSSDDCNSESCPLVRPWSRHR